VKLRIDGRKYLPVKSAVMTNKTLTPRQYEAMRLFYIKCESQADCAKLMGLNSIRTVESHLNSARKKLGLNKRKAIVAALSIT
jgi:DNA-binding CsgD family transcriptional regulator